jgi:hypothetical protein
MKAKHGLILLSALSASVFAGSPIEPARYPQPQQRSEQPITYLCGGIGETESASMNQAANNHDAMLVFARSDGAYLADVNVEISDARGRPILNERCNGPIMLLDVQRNGTYHVRADFDGRTQSRTLHIGGKGPTKQVIILS